MAWLVGALQGDEHLQATLFRVSMTLPPPWSRHRDDAMEAAREFLDGPEQRGGVLAALLSVDVSKGAGWHWYGVVLKAGLPTRKASSVVLERAWMRASNASLNGMALPKAVAGWDAFVQTGDVEAMAGRRSFAMNLSSVVRYAYKPWPQKLGTRLPERDVLERGAFIGATAAGRLQP